MNASKLPLNVWKRIFSITFNSVNKNANCYSTINVDEEYRCNSRNKTKELYQYEKVFNVKPSYGILIVESDCKCSIKSLDPEEFPNFDHAIVSIKSPTVIDKDCIDVRMVGDDLDRLKLRLSKMSEAECEVKIPLKYNIDAILENDASIYLGTFENDSIAVSTDTGNVHTKNIKSVDMSVSTNSGKLNFDGVLQGNVSLSGKSLICHAKRLHGTSFQIEADHLETEIESSYMTEGSIVAQSGSINVKNLHGSTKIHVHEGNININALHGQVGAYLGKGNCDVQVTELLNDSYCEVEQGNINLHYLKPEGNNVELLSSSLTIAPEFESKGERSKIDNEDYFCTPSEKGKPLFKAHTKEGSLTVKIRSWFESLGIKV